LVTGAAILGAVVFNLWPEILSGSLDLEVLGLTSENVVSGDTFGSFRPRGSNDLLKQSESI